MRLDVAWYRGTVGTKYIIRYVDGVLGFTTFCGEGRVRFSVLGAFVQARLTLIVSEVADKLHVSKYTTV
jgi:hypothetical protein